MKIKIEELSRQLKKTFRGSREDWGAETERSMQILEQFEKEFGQEIVELEPA